MEGGGAEGEGVARAAKLGGASAAVLLIAAGLISRWEGERFVAYPDPATGGAPWTVCYGHTGPDVDRSKRYTRAECEALLDADMRQANRYVHRCVGRPMPEGVEAALTSFVFNVGPKWLCKDSMIGLYARAGDWPNTCKSLELYKYAGGRVFRGLVLRRADERRVCEQGLR